MALSYRKRGSHGSTASLSLVILGVSFRRARGFSVVALKPDRPPRWAAARASVPGACHCAASRGSAPALCGIGMGYPWPTAMGVRWTVTFGAVMIGLGARDPSSYGQSWLGPTWALYIGHGLFMGLLGNSGPERARCMSYVSRWFEPAARFGPLGADRERSSTISGCDPGRQFFEISIAKLTAWAEDHADVRRRCWWRIVVTDRIDSPSRPPPEISAPFGGHE